MAVLERVYSPAAVQELARRTGRVLLVCDGALVDASSVVAGHPGGAQLLTAHAGADVSQVFRGEAQGGAGHAHSRTAQQLLASLRVGAVAEHGEALEPPPLPAADVARRAEQACLLDPAKGLVFQARQPGSL